MLSESSKQVSQQAKKLYEDRYREELEASHHGQFICIEPESADYFLGDTLDAAVNKAMDVYPDRLTHTLRIGHSAALHLGVLQ